MSRIFFSSRFPIRSELLARASAAVLVLCLLAVGTVQADEAAPPWDLGYLLYLDPAAVTAADLHDRAVFLEENYRAHHCVNGIIWQGVFAEIADDAPSLYGTGGDSAIFTGFYLAASVYRFLVTGAAQDLDAVYDAVRGLHILTHASGTPGVILRCAFPADQPEKWRYPDAWRSRIEAGFIYESPDDVPDIADPGACYPVFLFYTRATRDQLTGILYGLGVVLAELDPAQYRYDAALHQTILAIRATACVIADALFARLEGTGFILRDHCNRTGSTAILVDGLLKVQLLAVCRAALEGDAAADEARGRRIERLYQREFRRAFFLNDGDLGDLFNRSSLTGSYYSYNLRFARSFTIHLLEDDPGRRQQVVDYMTKHVWRYVSEHRNTHFIFLYSAASGETAWLPEAVRSLQELSLRPLRDWSSPLYDRDCYPPRPVLLYGDVGLYVVPAHLREPTEYFVWQKDPFATGNGELELEANKEATGLDFLLPYWMGRWYGFLAQGDAVNPND